MNEMPNWVIVLVLALLASSCTAAALEPRAAFVTYDEKRLTITHSSRAPDKASTLLDRQLQAELEAIAGIADLVIWQVEDAQALSFAHYVGQAIHTGQIEHSFAAEAICGGVRDERVIDLYLGDGEGMLVHYWLNRADPSAGLHEVRRLWTNPDVERCQVSGQGVFIDNGPLGTTAYSASEETDPILRSASEFEFAAPQPIVLGAADAYSPPDTSVSPVVETYPVASSNDAADDPVVLVANPSLVWVVGTDKQRGLNAYDLQGNRVLSIERGRLNNVDATELAPGKFLLAASNRTHMTLDLFIADMSEASLTLRHAEPVSLNDPYGLCMGSTPQGMSVFIGGTNGEVQQWSVGIDGQSAEYVRTLNYETQTEGCVLASDTQLLVGEEGRGIWSTDLTTGKSKLLAPISAGGLVADVEGLDVCPSSQGPLLVASSQGDDSYVLYTIDAGLAQQAKFSIDANIDLGIDGASETDGLACSTAAMDGFPRGILVVQDGRNVAPQQNQNFKIVDWRSVEALLQSH